MTVDGRMVGDIGKGLCLLVGIAPGDTRSDVEAAVDKIAGLRVFPDADGKMNRSVLEAGGAVLVISQFTLLGDARKGRRPSFKGAAPPEKAAGLIARMVDEFRERGAQTSEGAFGAHMLVDLVNDGPVTLILEIRDGRVS